MTLTTHFNAKSRISRRARTETETFGDASLSRYLPAIQSSRQQRPEEKEIEGTKKASAPVRIIRRSMRGPE